MPAEDKAIVRRFFDEVCNQRKLDVADELFAEDHIYHDPSTPDAAPGPAGQKQLVTLYQSAFSDAHWHVREIIEADDRIVTRWTGEGTNDGELMGIPATGKHVEVDGIWIHHVTDGEIVESWNVWDTLGMMRQLGLVPEPAGATA